MLFVSVCFWYRNLGEKEGIGIC